MKNELVLILDFGGQYNQLIARRVRECNVYCEVKPYTVSMEEIQALNPKAIIFTGGPNSVYGAGAPVVPKAIFESGIPILGICYGAQLLAPSLGGQVQSAPEREYGKTDITYREHPLFSGIEKNNTCWMSHTDFVRSCRRDFKFGLYPDLPQCGFWLRCAKAIRSAVPSGGHAYQAGNADSEKFFVSCGRLFRRLGDGPLMRKIPFRR